LLGEGVVIAGLYAQYWTARTTRRGELIPGFADLVGTSELDPEWGRELVELVVAAGAAHAESLATTERAPESPMKRAAVVLREVKAALAFAFDGSRFTKARAALAKVSRLHPQPKSQDDMALALEGFAGLGKDHRAHLGEISGFDVKLLDEAATLAVRLRERSGENRLAERSRASREALALRNRLLNGLYERMSHIRRAARYLFREHPHIVRQFTSEPNRTRQRKYYEARRGVPSQDTRPSS
jgi:hypothetical protein